MRLALISGLVKAPGFLIPVVIAAAFGAGHLTDAYFLAYGGVLLVGGTIGQPLEAAVVPFAARALSSGRIAARAFTKSLSVGGLGIGLAAALLGGLLIQLGLFIAPPSGVSTATVFEFYVLLAPAAIAWCVAGLYSGALTSAWHLEVSAVGYGFRGAGALVGAAFGGLIHELWPVAVGVSVGEWARVWWLERRWAHTVAAASSGDAEQQGSGFLSAAASQIGAQGSLALAQFVERFLVGTVAVASISHVEYAMRLLMAVSVLFDGGVAPWLLAHWSNARVQGKLRSDWRSVYGPLALASGAATAVACGIVVAAPLAVGLILHHGAFTAADASAVTTLLRWYAGAYLLNMTALCLERLLLARTQNRLILMLTIARVSVRLGTVVYLLPTNGVLALPLGFAAGELVYVAGLLWASGREVDVRTA